MANYKHSLSILQLFSDLGVVDPSDPIQHVPQVLRVGKQLRIYIFVSFVILRMARVLGKDDRRGYLVASPPFRNDVLSVLVYDSHFIEFLHREGHTCKAP